MGGNLTGGEKFGSSFVLTPQGLTIGLPGISSIWFAK
jgi:hypothetical protein